MFSLPTRGDAGPGLGAELDRPVWFDHLLNSAFDNIGEQGRETASFDLYYMRVEEMLADVCRWT